jgi:hypothetical protein
MSIEPLMDRHARLLIARAIVERTRDYDQDALDDLFRSMGEIEERHGLILKLTDEEEAAVAAASERLARREKLAALEPSGPVEDFLPETDEAILARLAKLSEQEQDAIFAMVALLIDITVPVPRLSATQVADLRRRLKEIN